jgi:hypothetical protein
MEEEWVYFDSNNGSGKVTAVSNLGRIIKYNKIIETTSRRTIHIDGKKISVNRFVADHFLITVKRPDQSRIKIIDANADNVNNVTNLKYASAAEIASEAYSDPILREKHSIRMKKLYQDPKFHKMMDEVVKHKKISEIGKEKIREAVKRYHSDPENKRRRILSIKRANIKKLKLRGNENLCSFLFFEDDLLTLKTGNLSSSAFLSHIMKNILSVYDRKDLSDKNEKSRNSKREKSELMYRYTIDTIRRRLKSMLSSVSELEIFGDLF